MLELVGSKERCRVLWVSAEGLGEAFHACIISGLDGVSV